MKVLVTGASGFIGRHLVSFLADKGVSGVAVARTKLDHLPPSWRYVCRDQILFGEPIDFGEELAVVHLEVVQHIINPSAADERRIFKINVEGIGLWLDWMEQRNIDHFVYFSSIKAVKSSMGVLTEDAEGPGDTIYGRSKWLAEGKVKDWSLRGSERSVAIIRPSLVYGPGCIANMWALVEAIDRNRFFLVRNQENEKSIVSLENVLSATWFILNSRPVPFDIFNLVDAKNYTIPELSEMICSALGKRARIPQLPGFFVRGLALLGDVITRIMGRPMPLTTARLDSLLEHTAFSSDKLVMQGFKHPQTTQEGLDRLADSYRKTLERK